MCNATTLSMNALEVVETDVGSFDKKSRKVECENLNGTQLS